MTLPPILEHKDYAAPTAFSPDALLREARRQKGIAAGTVPSVCVLDSDGDLVRRLTLQGRGRVDQTWACYHTELIRVVESKMEFGIVGCAVGASFAVLVAEELFSSDCLEESEGSRGKAVARRDERSSAQGIRACACA